MQSSAGAVTPRYLGKATGLGRKRVLTTKRETQHVAGCPVLDYFLFLFSTYNKCSIFVLYFMFYVFAFIGLSE